MPDDGVRELTCFVEDDATVFRVKVTEDSDVLDLRRLVKKSNRHLFRRLEIDETDLVLYKVRLRLFVIQKQKGWG